MGDILTKNALIFTSKLKKSVFKLFRGGGWPKEAK
jgi:hypothetical protein